MQRPITIIFLVAIILLSTISNTFGSKLENSTDSSKNFSIKPYIVPASLIGYGVVATVNSDLCLFNGIKTSSSALWVDDVIIVVPYISAYALNLIGIEGKNRFMERTLSMAIAVGFTTAIAIGTKQVVDVERPNGKNSKSFPSGHTAYAFAGAEFLWQEFGEVSVWYGIAGYAVATTVGMFRVFHNEHWFADVAAGAGIGILSTKLAYRISPWLNDKLISRICPTNCTTTIYPVLDNRSLGLSLKLTF